MDRKLEKYAWSPNVILDHQRKTFFCIFSFKMAGFVDDNQKHDFKGGSGERQLTRILTLW